MPKVKSNSGAKKRFRVTKNGKVVRAKGFKSHLLESKSSKRKRQLRGTTVTSEAETKRVKRMIPYK
ncbi:MAG: 50S ribosomal protein L35 [Spirochaetes bacterium]|jgi:large subunit ribosomal protein L35|nr:50S ribosomal protein L35 [Spirochaetota bacterium]